MVAKIIELNGNRVTLDVDFTDAFEGKEEVEITVGTKKKRSLDANAYFHVLVGKIADKLRISKAKCKNILISRYGQYEIIDGEQTIISVSSEIDMENREDIHCNPLGYGYVNGKQFTHYAIMRPSHLLDSKEFAILLDGTVDEAKQMGIEVLSPEEIKRIESLWK